MHLATTLTDPKNILTGAVILASFATIVTLAAPMMTGSNLEGRLKAVANRREELRRKSREAINKSSSNTLRRTDESIYKRIVDRLQLSRLLEDPKVVDKLAQAGLRGQRPVSIFYFSRMIAPIALAIFTTIYLFLINDFGTTGIQKLACIIAAMMIGYYAPNIYISNIAQKRRDSIVQAFPDTLDLLLICVESGMSIEAAIQKVSQEVGASSIEMAEELALLVAELSYLPERRLAYDGLARRTNNPGVKSVATAMIQAERYGTPLGTALRVMAKENRDLRLAAAEKKAAALPAKLTVPMIFFFLPVLFVVILGPAILKVQAIMG